MFSGVHVYKSILGKPRKTIYSVVIIWPACLHGIQKVLSITIKGLEAEKNGKQSSLFFRPAGIIDKPSVTVRDKKVREKSQAKRLSEFEITCRPGELSDALLVHQEVYGLLELTF